MFERGGRDGRGWMSKGLVVLAAVGLLVGGIGVGGIGVPVAAAQEPGYGEPEQSEEPQGGSWEMDYVDSSGSKVGGIVPVKPGKGGGTGRLTGASWLSGSYSDDQLKGMAPTGNTFGKATRGRGPSSFSFAVDFGWNPGEFGINPNEASVTLGGTTFDL